MRPPFCVVCSKRFDPFNGDGELVSFARDAADAEWYKRAEQPGFVGHPPHQEWFCGEHAKQVRAFTQLTLGEALAKVRG